MAEIGHGEQCPEAGNLSLTVPKRIMLTCSTAQANAPPPTLQQAQTSALLTLLNLNQTADAFNSPLTNVTKATTSAAKPVAPPGPPVWKVLILDQYTKDILATVLRVQDLRDVGVTLHVYAYLKSRDRPSD